MVRVVVSCAVMALAIASCGDDQGPAGADGTGASTATAGSEEAGVDETTEPPPATPAPSCVLDDDAWELLEPMAQPRRAPTAIELADGSILVTGGVVYDCETPQGSVTASVERFDPITHTWQPAPDMLHPRAYHGAFLLDDGDVVVTGGHWETASASVDRYDVETATWSPGPELPVALTSSIARSNGELRVVLGRDAQNQAHGFRWNDGWQAITAPPSVSSALRLWPWGDGLVLAGVGVARAMTYDPIEDVWSPTPSPVESGAGWKTELTTSVQTSALLGPGELFVLATTGGAHPDIEQQGVAVRLLEGADRWIGGAPGPLWGDTISGMARSFAPGWVVAFVNGRATWVDVYDATLDAWCTAHAPTQIHGTMAVLPDGSVLFTGSDCNEPGPLLWTPW